MQKHFYFAFSNFLGIGPAKFQLLLQYFKTAEAAYKASAKDLSEILGERLTKKFIEFRERFDIEKKLQEALQKDILIIPQNSPDYPQQLSEIKDPPICLYVRSDSWKDILKHDLRFAIVGTRKPSEYGRKLTAKITSHLAEAGFLIISGMAVGVDTIAHQTALDKNAPTLAVLGCGVDIVYPAVNRALYNQIIRKGAVISEFPPGTLVKKGLFIARNRLISALSDAVLVVEGKKDSGSLITARYAAEQGKDVFALPGRIDNPNSQAPNILIKEGATPVLQIQDLLQSFSSRINISQIEKKKDLSPEEKKIIDTLEKKELFLDELCQQIESSPQDILPILTMLEIKGLVKKLPDGKLRLI